MLTKTSKQLLLAASLIALVVFSFASCLKAKDTGCVFNECATVANPPEIQTIQSYLTSHNLTAIQHCSGMFYKVDSATGAGTGKKPDACSTVTVKYKGTLTDGTVFDQNTSGVTFSLKDLIGGWRVGIPLIKEGGRITLYIPPSLGYGSQQAGSVPPNSTLIFDIQLISVQ